ncbi:unnamed protein product [Fraxinus pennsylvanica]|uniref:Uncharacterized protein n=1 Tax=Fraxinus pennsylvanica TaxID=56036 RepID=A0AAD2A132_9LAMI|nr:unnamed protein product [Fraxinus pennsylvanica]
MSTHTQRMLIIQHASEDLGFKTLREAVLLLKPGDKVLVLAIIQQAASSAVQSRKLQDNEKLKDIKEAIKQKQDKYSNCAEIEGIRILAEARQVEFDIAVEAGFLNEVAAEYAKKIEATRVILPRRFSALQGEKNLAYSGNNPLRERLLHDKRAEFVSPGPQLSSKIANRGKGRPNIRPLAQKLPKKVCARRSSDTSSSILPPRKSNGFRRLKRVSSSSSSLPSKKQRVEDQPFIGIQPAFLDRLNAELEVSDTVNSIIKKFWLQKHSEKLQGLEDSQVKIGALRNMVKAMIYTIEDKKRSSKLLRKTEGLVDEKAKLLKKVGELEDELSILNNLKYKMQTRLNRRDAKIVKLKARVKAREGETEKAKNEATAAIEDFKETEEYRALREELYHAAIDSIAAARPDYDISFLHSSREDENENEDELSTDEDLEDWKTAENC